MKFRPGTRRPGGRALCTPDWVLLERQVELPEEEISSRHRLLAFVPRRASSQAKEATEDHPERRAGTPDGHGDGDTSDVGEAHRSGDGSDQRPEVSDCRTLLVTPATHHVHRRADLRIRTSPNQPEKTGPATTSWVKISASWVPPMGPGWKVMPRAIWRCKSADAASLAGRRPWEALPWLHAPVSEESYRAAAVTRRPTSFTATRSPDKQLLFQLYPDGTGISVHITPAPLRTATSQATQSDESVGALVRTT